MKDNGMCFFCGRLHQTFNIDTCIREMWRSMPSSCRECGGTDGHVSSCSIGLKAEALSEDMDERQAQLVAEFPTLTPRV